MLSKADRLELMTELRKEQRENHRNFATLVIGFFTVLLTGVIAAAGWTLAKQGLFSLSRTEVEAMRELHDNIKPISHALLADVQDKVLSAIHEVSFSTPSARFNSAVTAAEERMRELGPVLADDADYLALKDILVALRMIVDQRYEDAHKSLCAVLQQERYDSDLEALAYALRGTVSLLRQTTTADRVANYSVAQQDFIAAEQEMTNSKGGARLGLISNGLGACAVYEGQRKTAANDPEGAVASFSKAIGYFREQYKRDGTLASFQKQINNSGFLRLLIIRQCIAHPQLESKLMDIVRDGNPEASLRIADNDLRLAVGLWHDRATLLSRVGYFVTAAQYREKFASRSLESYQPAIDLIGDLVRSGEFADVIGSVTSASEAAARVTKYLRDDETIAPLFELKDPELNARLAQALTQPAAGQEVP